MTIEEIDCKEYEHKLEIISIARKMVEQTTSLDDLIMDMLTEIECLQDLGHERMEIERRAKSE